MRAATLILVGLGFWSTGCTTDRCKTDSDCFVPEVCVARRCEAPLPGSTDLGNEDVEDLSESGRDIGSSDMTAPQTDMLEAIDMSIGPDLADGGTADIGMPDGTAASCEVDVFSFMCMDDPYEPNNIAFDGERLSTETFGCPVGGFKPFVRELDGTMCPVDGTDWYRLNFYECDDAAFIVEFQVELLSDCDPNVIGIEARDFDCADELVDCTIEDGKPTLRVIMERQNVPQFSTTYVQVHNKMQDVTFDYRLSVEVRR